MADNANTPCVYHPSAVNQTELIFLLEGIFVGKKILHGGNNNLGFIKDVHQW